MREAVIISSVRTPVGRAFKGTLRATRPDELAATAIKGALERVPQLDPKEIEDVILGCAMPEGEQGMNVARIASLRAGLPVEVAAMTVNRFCASGLQAIAIAAERIMAGGVDIMVAGGTESMSMIPMGGNKIRQTRGSWITTLTLISRWVSQPSDWQRGLGSRARLRTGFLCAAIRRRWPQLRPASSRRRRCPCR